MVKRKKKKRIHNLYEKYPKINYNNKQDKELKTVKHRIPLKYWEMEIFVEQRHISNYRSIIIDHSNRNRFNSDEN